MYDRPAPPPFHRRGPRKRVASRISEVWRGEKWRGKKGRGKKRAESPAAVLAALSPTLHTAGDQGSPQRIENKTLKTPDNWDGVSLPLENKPAPGLGVITGTVAAWPSTVNTVDTVHTGKQVHGANHSLCHQIARTRLFQQSVRFLFFFNGGSLALLFRQPPFGVRGRDGCPLIMAAPAGNGWERLVVADLSPPPPFDLTLPHTPGDIAQALVTRCHTTVTYCHAHLTPPHTAMSTTRVLPVSATLRPSNMSARTARLS